MNFDRADSTRGCACVMRKLLLAGLSAVSLLAAHPAPAQLPVIDSASIAQLVNQVTVLKQQLQEAIQTYNETIQIYQQALGIKNGVSGPTQAGNWAAALNNPALQNPLPFATTAFPGYLGGNTSPAGLPYGQTYLNQNLAANFLADTGPQGTLLRHAFYTISSIEATVTNNLQALETRAQQLPQIESQLASASTVQQMQSITARLAAESNFIANQKAQAENIQASAAAQVAQLEQAQVQMSFQDEATGISNMCNSFSQTGVGVALSVCAASN
jgi:hypothetical protein